MKAIVGVMPPLIWRSVFIKSGWDVEFLGDQKTFQDGSKVIAGELAVSPENLSKVRQKTGLCKELLVMQP